VGDSVNAHSSYGADISNIGLNSDSDNDDAEIENYHSMLKDNYSDEVKSQASFHTFEPI
jgi:hypothetical protein